MQHFSPFNENQHFFASCVYGWRVANDPYTAINKLLKDYGKHGPLHILLHHVPVHLRTNYEIVYYVPQVEGVTKVYQGEITR